MKMNSRAIGAMAGLLLCGPVFADCDMRDATPAELQYKARAEAALKEALPATPAKWTMKPSTKEAGRFSVCSSDKIGEFEIRVSGTYVYARAKEERDRLYAERRKVDKEIENLRELPPEVKKERQVWLDKMSEANRASNAASKAGDKTLARQKDSEAEGYSAKGRAVRDGYWQRIQPEVDKLQARAKSLNDGDPRIEVVLIANERFPQSPPPYTSKVLTAGKVPSQNPGLKVQGVRLMVIGSDPERTEIEALLDQQKLNRLVQ
jgi:hypothetical protein